jgi:hypothetical protein
MVLSNFKANNSIKDNGRVIINTTVNKLISMLDSDVTTKVISINKEVISSLMFVKVIDKEVIIKLQGVIIKLGEVIIKLEGVIIKLEEVTQRNQLHLTDPLS